MHLKKLPTYWGHCSHIVSETALLDNLQRAPPSIFLLEANFHPYAEAQLCRQVRCTLVDACVLSNEELSQLLVEGCISNMLATDYLVQALRNSGRLILLSDMDKFQHKISSLEMLCRSIRKIVDLGCTVILIGNKIMLTVPEILQMLPDAQIWTVCGDHNQRKEG